MKEIKLFNSDKVALVDDSDFELLNQYRWVLTVSKETHEYAISTINGVRHYMHNFITGNSFTDHKNGNGLNNQSHNLRESNYQLNAANRKKPRTGITSKYKGVSWSKARQKFIAGIKVNDRSINLGGFAEEAEAARAYDKAAMKHFGEHARTNFPSTFDERYIYENKL